MVKVAPEAPTISESEVIVGAVVIVAATKLLKIAVVYS